VSHPMIWRGVLNSNVHADKAGEILRPNKIREQTARLLLQGGMDPNNSTDGSPSAWEVVVKELHVTSPEYAASLAKLFIEYGAHPKVTGADKVIDSFYANKRRDTDSTLVAEEPGKTSRSSTWKSSRSSKFLKKVFHARQSTS
jgi:hypothetical protein